MARQADIDKRLSGMGNDSSMPESCMRCPYLLLMQQFGDILRHIDPATDNPPAVPATIPPRAVPAIVPTTPAVPDVVPAQPAEERLVDLPDVFVESLYTDIPRYNRLMRLLRGDILDLINDSQQESLRWYHVRRVLEDRGLVYLNMKKKKIGDALSKILEGLKTGDNLRKQATDYALEKLKESFHEWPENSFDRYLCNQVEALFIKEGIVGPYQPSQKRQVFRKI